MIGRKIELINPELPLILELAGKNVKIVCITLM